MRTISRLVQATAAQLLGDVLMWTGVPCDAIGSVLSDSFTPGTTPSQW